MEYIDQMGAALNIKKVPKRIISLVPSQTELLHYFGLENEVVGITKFCIHPEEWFQNKKRVGGTKKVNFDAIEALAPDLVIGNKEENEKSDIETLSKLYPTWMSDILTLEDAFDMILKLGVLLDRSEKAVHLVDQLQSGFTEIRSQKRGKDQSVAYFIWQDPMMVAASGTFIDEMLKALGYKNAFADAERYPAITEELLKNADPDLIFLSSEPYPYKEKHIDYFLGLCPEAKVTLVDGELFSWYGSRMLEALKLFSNQD